MAKNSKLSDTPEYTIQMVSQQTGILPVTLRAWERRHSVPVPYRSDNRYRLYSEQDVAVLRWLKSKVDSGIPISRAVEELRSTQREGEWPDMGHLAAPLRSPAPAPAQKPPSVYTRALFNALTKHDEQRSSSLLQEIGASYDLRTALLQVCAPVLAEIGEAWYRGEIRVTSEHFASNYLRGRLLALLQSFPFRRSMPLVLIGCAPGEQHEIGSLMLAVLLRREGYRVEFLGADVPLIDLADYARYQKPRMIILSATLPDTAAKLARFAEMLKGLRPQPLFGFGGAAFNRQPALLASIDGIYLGNSIDEALEKALELLDPALQPSAR